MGRNIARGVIGFFLGIGVLTLSFVLMVAYVDGFEGFFTGYTNQVVDWGHQISSNDTVFQPPVTQR